MADCSAARSVRLAMARLGRCCPVGMNASNFAPRPQIISEVGTAVFCCTPGQTKLSARKNRWKSPTSRFVDFSDAFDSTSNPGMRP